MTEHTTLPWKSNGPHNISGKFTCYIDGALSGNMIYGLQIARVRSDDKEEAEANAHLIVTACNCHADLLEALKLIMRCDEKGFIDLKPSWHNQVRQAIRQVDEQIR